MFDAPTRKAAGDNLVGFGDALNGRGADLNETIGKLPVLEDRLTSVMANLVGPEDGHPGLLLRALRRRARRGAGLEDERAPVHDDGRHVRRDLAPTSARCRTRSTRRRARSTRAPSRCASSARSSSTPPRCRPTSTAAAVELRRSLPDVNGALVAATPVQRRLVAAQRAAARTPSTRSTASSRRRRRTGRCAGCRRRSARSRRRSATSARTSRSATTGTTSGRSRPSTSPRRTTPAARSARCSTWARARRAPTASATPAPTSSPTARAACPATARQDLHGTFYGPAVTPDGKADCAAGQTGYVMAANPYRDKSVKGDPYRRAAVDRFAIAGAARPALRAARQERPRRRPRPVARAGRRDVHRLARRPRRRRPEGRHAVRRRRSPRHGAFRVGLADAAGRRRRRRTSASRRRSRSATTTRSRRSSRRRTTSARTRPCASRASRSARSRRSRTPRTAAQAARRDDAPRAQGPAAAPRRDDEDPPAHLPRGQLLRRRAAGLGVGAEAPRRRPHPDQPDERAGPARPGAVSASRRRRAATCRASSRSSRAASATAARPALNRSIPYWAPAYRDTSIVADALQGTENHDLSRFIANEGATAAALDRHAEELKSLIVDFDATAATLAAHDRQLSSAVAELPRTLRAGRARAAHAQRRVPAGAAPDPRRAPGRALLVARRSTPRSRSSARCAASCPSPSCAACRATCAPSCRR